MTAVDALPAKSRQRAARSRWAALPRDVVDSTIRGALAEDVGHGDITTELTIDPRARGDAQFVAKDAGVVSGLHVSRYVFERIDPTIEWLAVTDDGDKVAPGQPLATVKGSVAGILKAERIALNFLQRMSGVATLTSRFVAAVSHTQARIIDTRKTAPGLRLLDKYAVVCGGGRNHRFGLSDGILIKDNHIAAAGGIPKVLELVRQRAPQGLNVEIEVDRLDQIQDALDGRANIILLDNMDATTLSQAVAMIAGSAKTEASGSVSLATVVAIADAGVDYISVGSLTHSAPALDIGLDLELLS